MTRLRSLIGFGLAATLSSLALNANAAEVALDTRLLEEWAREERRLTVVEEADGLSLTSARSSEHGMDEIRADFATDGLEFQHLFVSTEPGNATVISYRLHFASLVEFEDVDQDGRLDLGEPVVKRTPLDGRPGTTLALEAGPDGSHVALVRVPLNATNESGILPVDDGQRTPAPTFELEILMTPRPLEQGGRSTLPTEVPFAWRLEAFRPQQNRSMLALEIRARSTVEFDAEATGLRAQDRAFATSYSWEPDLLVDGRRAPVMASIVETPGGALAGEDVGIFLAHEPGGSVQGQSALAAQRFGPIEASLPGVPGGLPKGDWGTYLTGLALTGFLVGTISVFRLRRGP